MEWKSYRFVQKKGLEKGLIVEMTPLKAKRLTTINEQIDGDFAHLLEVCHIDDQMPFREIREFLIREYELTLSEFTIRNWYLLLVGQPRTRSEAQDVRY